MCRSGVGGKDVGKGEQKGSDKRVGASTKKQDAGVVKTSSEINLARDDGRSETPEGKGVSTGKLKVFRRICAPRQMIRSGEKKK